MSRASSIYGNKHIVNYIDNKHDHDKEVPFIGAGSGGGGGAEGGVAPQRKLGGGAKRVFAPPPPDTCR